MQTPQVNGLTALGTSNAIQVPNRVVQHSFEAWFTHNAINANKITALTLKIQASLANAGKTGVVTDAGPVLAIGSTAERVANSAFTYRIDDVNYNKGAVAAGTVFSSNHVVTLSTFGAINVYIDSAGAILTLSTQLGQDQTTPLASASAAAAITVAEGIPVPAGYAYLGYVLIEANGTTWTANTDDMTDGSDLTTATFISDSVTYTTIFTEAFDAPAIARQRTMFTLSNTWSNYMRIFVSTLTGTGKVYCRHIPIRWERG
jgi:hypothetical protein